MVLLAEVKHRLELSWLFYPENKVLNFAHEQDFNIEDEVSIKIKNIKLIPTLESTIFWYM